MELGTEYMAIKIKTERKLDINVPPDGKTTHCYQ